MSFDDISPSALPFTSRIRDYTQGLRDPSSINIAASIVIFEYVDLAKRILLEHRVKEFTAADVVSLAALLELRDRETRKNADTEVL